MAAIPVPGPDGFLLSPDDPLRAAHVRLNDYLLAEEQRDTARTPFDVGVWRRLPKRDLVDQVQAILLRLEWLDQRDRELARERKARLVPHNAYRERKPSQLRTHETQNRTFASP